MGVIHMLDAQKIVVLVPGIIQILELQVEGKQKMNAAQFINGYEHIFDKMFDV